MANTSTSSSALLAASIKRLLHDLKEVRENPVPNVSCLPLEDDLFVWHGNVRSSPEGSLQGAPIHFILSFPPTYPHSPPECRLLQPVPHPNVKPVTGIIQVLHSQQGQQGRSQPIPRQARWKLALWDCIPGKDSWSSSYSVLSIMLQLQVFLMDEDLHYDHQQITPAAAISKALQCDCPHCPHAGSDNHIHPALPADADLAAAKQLREKQAVAKPFVLARSRATGLYLKQHQKAPPARPTPAAAAAAAAVAVGSAAASHASSSCSSSCGGGASSSSSSDLTAMSSPGSTCSSSSSVLSGADNGWSTVKAKGSKAAKQQAAKAVVAAAARPAAAEMAGSSRFTPLRSAAARNVAAVQQQQLAVVAVSAAELPGQQQQGQLSKAAKKNMARSKKRQQQQDAHSAATTTNSSSSSSSAAANTTSGSIKTKTSSSSAAAAAAAAARQAGDAWFEVGAKKKAAEAKAQLYVSPLAQQLEQLQQQPMQQLIQQCMAGASFAAKPDTSNRGWDSSRSSSSCVDYPSAAEAAAAAAAATAAGPLGLLPRDAMLGVLCLLQPADLASLSQTCRAMKAASEDGALWQTLMAKSFPSHKLTASNMADWKAAYLLESSALLDELRCWWTRAGFEEDVLGLPLTYTVNPATKKVDYIQAHPDLLSVTAFKAGVRETPQREKFDALLPLYLTADHFNRALPHMEPLLRLLAPERVTAGGGCPPPESWLEVLPKVLNTQVVLLADNGLAASQKSLAVNCQVYRLLLAVCEHWNLWPAVSGRLESFMSHPKQRVKAATPNLGLLLPLLSCSPVRHSWGRVSGALLEEALDRKVLWMCKKDPGLVDNFKAAPGSPPDMQLLHGSWAGAAVSCRLMAFHLAFLQLVACPRGSTLEGVMDSADAMYGWPPAALGSRFSSVVKRIQQLSGWQEWFRVLGRSAPTAAAMSDLLRGAWRRSLSKGYHKANMDFSKVQASGVSRILLKGQSYTTPPGTKTVELEVHYKWKPEFHVRYLDGAVMLFGPGRKFLEMVAWNHQSSSKTTRPGAVTHSGDIMEFEQQSGKNLARISLMDMGPAISEAFVTLSAWSDAMLSDIIQPYVQLIEPSTGVELCQCHLDSAELAARRSHKCIIMARLYREANGGWGVQSVGQFCQGNTGSMYWNDGDSDGVGGMVAGIKALRV